MVEQSASLGCLGLGFRVRGLGFRVLGFRVLGFRASGLGFRPLGFKPSLGHGLGPPSVSRLFCACRVWKTGNPWHLMALGSGYRVLGSGPETLVGHICATTSIPYTMY